MYTLAIVDGDIQIGEGGILATVSGADMLVQELGSWIIEPLGSDVYNPAYGSDVYAHIGGVIDDEAISRVKRSVSSSVQKFIEYQSKRLQDAILSGKNQYSPNDIIASVSDIVVSNNATTIRVVIHLVTAGGLSVTVDREI